MRVDAHLIDGWPEAAWFAEWEPGSERVKVYHGIDVEVRDDRVFEGVWEGSFEAGAFDEAAAFCGTGFVTAGSELHLIPPFHPQERIYYSHDLYPTKRCASNSLLCWLTLTGEQLDLDWPDYYMDFLYILRAGHTSELPSIQLSGGKRLYLVELSGWSCESECRMAPRIGPGFQENFASYRAFLKAQIRAIMENAQNRPRPKTCVSALSEGFDSVGIAVLAREAGVTTALTITNKEDSRHIGERLGFDTIAKSSSDVCDARSHDEFFVHTFGHNRCMALLESHHRGAVMFGGHGGDEIWNCRTSFDSGQNLQRPRDTILAGNSCSEYRIRIGLVVVPTCLIGQWHWATVQKVSNSSEMVVFRDESIDYSRPIARRLGIEAGLKWSEFARSKTIGGILLADQMQPREEASYREFLAENVKGDWSRTDYEPLGKYVGSLYRWTSHWAVKRLKQRYVLPD